jgi:hypothetical protein
MFIGPHIPSPLLFAREARLSRAKYIKWARTFPHGELRAIELELVAMFRTHEKKWMKTYHQDVGISNV